MPQRADRSAQPSDAPDAGLDPRRAEDHRGSGVDTQAAFAARTRKHPDEVGARLRKDPAAVVSHCDDDFASSVSLADMFEGLDEAAADRLEATYAPADVHAMCTWEDSRVIALQAE